MHIHNIYFYISKLMPIRKLSCIWVCVCVHNLYMQVTKILLSNSLWWIDNCWIASDEWRVINDCLGGALLYCYIERLRQQYGPSSFTVSSSRDERVADVVLSRVFKRVPWRNYVCFTGILPNRGSLIVNVTLCCTCNVQLGLESY